MTTRDRLIIVVVLLAAALAGTWFVGLAPKRKEAADLQSQIDTASQQLAAAQQKAAAARQAKARYDADYAQVATLGKAVPKSDALPSLLYQLQTAAHDSRIDFRSLKVTASSAGAAASTPAANAATAVASANGTGGAAPATATQAAAATLPPGAIVGSAGFPTMPFSFVFNGSFFDMERFLHAIQGFVRVHGQSVDVSGRLLSVDAFSLTAGPNGFPDVKASISATAYVLSPNDTSSSATPSTSATAGTTSASSGAAAPAPTATASEVSK